RHEVNYIQSESYENQNSHDSFSHQSIHDPNDSEKSLKEVNNDVRNGLEDFKRCVRSIRTVHWKLYDRDDGGGIHMLGIPFRALSFIIQQELKKPEKFRIMLNLSVEELSLLTKKKKKKKNILESLKDSSLAAISIYTPGSTVFP
ncbi:hypothetical protein Tco_0622796, partial [Tanacetum coccineum]